MLKHEQAFRKEEYKPLIINALDGSSEAVLTRIKEIPGLIVFDEIESQVGDLIKLRNPSYKYSAETLSEAVQDFFQEQSPANYGNWVYYPWRNMLVHMLPEEEFVEVRTIRNKNIITATEQERLRSKKVGIIGLSVGQSVALTLALERGCGEIRLADFDTLELSNLNRIRTGVYNLGVRKTILAAREIAEIDPYIHVVLFNEGIHDSNIDEFFEQGGRLDLLIEECDSIEVKIKSRLKAKKLKVPVLMDTSDRGMLDVERFDLEPTRPVFHGLLERFGAEEELTSKLSSQRTEVLMALLDFENLSSRAKASMLEVGITLTTWPQVASSVILGGGACGYFSRQILLGEKVQSKRYYIDLEKIVHINHGS